MDNFTLFFTATILDWKQLLKPDAHKKIIMDSLKFLVEDKRIFLYAFVIMPNHIHLLWRMQENHELHDVQRDFLKYTAQQIKFRLINTNPFLLSQFRRQEVIGNTNSGKGIHITKGCIISKYLNKSLIIYTIILCKTSGD